MLTGWLLLALASLGAPAASTRGGPAKTTVLFADDFESGDLARGGWLKKDASVARTSKFAGEFGARLGKAAALERAVDPGASKALELRFAYRTARLAKGEGLVVEWSNGSAWTPAKTLVSATWANVVVRLPDAATASPKLKVRLRLTSAAADAFADLDDLQIIGTTEGTNI